MARRWSFLVYVAVALFSLWMRTGFPVHVIAGAGYDDGLFVELARHLGAGEWLGPFDNRTLVKGMAYPLFILGAFVAGIPLKIAEQAVYLAAAFLLAGLIARSRPVLAAILFCALALNPILWTDSLARVIREGLYIGLSLAVVALATRICLSRPQRWYGALGWGTLAGLVAAVFWLTREEGFWLAPSLLCVLVVAVAAGWRSAKPRLPALAAAILVFAACVSLVAARNMRHYGVFETNEVQSASFRHAYGALSRIRPDEWHRFVVFPRDARLRAYAASPAARELEPALDGATGERWRAIGCRQTGIDPCPEILAGWFQWALRDAVAQAGHYGSAADAAAFYDRLAGEIDAACDRGILACLPPRATLAPPFRWQYVADVLCEAPVLAGIVLRMGAGEIVPIASIGPANLTAGFADMVGRIAPLAGHRVVTGWVASIGVPGVRVRSSDKAGMSASTDMLPAPELTGLPAGWTALRFVLDTDCPPENCEVVGVEPRGGEAAIPLSHAAAGSGVRENDIWVQIDSSTTAPLASASARRDGVILRIAQAISRLYAALMPIGVVLACAGLGLAWTWRRYAAAPPVLFALVFASAAAVASRIALLSYLEVTSIPSANTLYASPATPFAILFAVIGTYLGIEAVRGKAGRVNADPPGK